jgi:hypothetical protein
MFTVEDLIEADEIFDEIVIMFDIILSNSHTHNGIHTNAFVVDL